MKVILFAAVLPVALLATGFQFAAWGEWSGQDGGAAKAGASGQDPQTDDQKRPPTNQVKPFMRAKLEHAQKVLEALALEDFDSLAKHSQEISLLSLASNWQVLQTPEYLRQSEDFRRSVDAMTEAARKKNLDGATVAYVRTTFGCVDCHKYVRRVKIAGHGTIDPRPVGD